MPTSSVTSKVASTSVPAGIAPLPETRVAASGRRWPAIVALLLGGVIILGVGFGPGLAHNASHDTRHSLSFPCH
jgi:cobalt transporter subunit CbtB